MKKSSILLTGLFIGAAGVFTAILFAPYKGTKTKNIIGRKGQKYKDYILDNYNNISDSDQYSFEEAQDKAERLSNKVIDKAEQIKSDIN